MTHTFIVRHGRPAAVWGGGDDDPGLDPEGDRQALNAMRTLVNLSPDERPTRVISSPLRRCQESAAPLAEALGVRVETVPEVGEIPTPVALASSARGPWLRASLSGRWSDIRGDLNYDRWRRAVFDAIKARPGAAIFSHFVAINAALSLLEDNDNVITFRPDHASITTLDIVGDDVRIVDRGREAATSIL